MSKVRRLMQELDKGKALYSFEGHALSIVPKRGSMFHISCVN